MDDPDRTPLDDVDDEARHDWLTQLPQLRADARPDYADYADLEPKRDHR